jgi:hypothetical protein
LHAYHLFSNPAYEHLATEPDLPNPPLLGDNLFARSVSVVSSRNSAQPTTDLFTERFGDIDARYAAKFPTVANNPIIKAKNSISSRLRSNPTYKLIDQLDKTPLRKSWFKNKNSQSEKSAAQSFLTYLVSRLSPTQSSFSSTPVGRPSQSFTNYLDKRSANGKSSRRANSQLIPRRERTFEQNPPGFEQPISVSESCIAHVEREMERFPIGRTKHLETATGIDAGHQVNHERPQADRPDASLLPTTMPDSSGGEPNHPADTHYIEKEQDDLVGDEGDFSDIHGEETDISVRVISKIAHPRRVRSKSTSRIFGYRQTGIYIVHQDESGDYHEFLLNQIEFMFDFLQESFDTFQRIFLENNQTLIEFLKKLHKIQSILQLSAGINTPSIPTQQFPKNQLGVRQKRGRQQKNTTGKDETGSSNRPRFHPRQSQIVRQAATPCHAHSQTHRARRYHPPPTPQEPSKRPSKGQTV